MLQVARAARDSRKPTDRLDILISTSTQTKPPFSPQSIESIFATNHIGHHILTILLLPLLHSTITRFPDTNSTRIVFTSSSFHQLGSELDLDLLTPPEVASTKSACYDGLWRYGRSKLANILFKRELSRRLMEGAFRELFSTGVGEVGRSAGDVDGDGDDGDQASKHIYVNSSFPGNIATEQMNIWTSYLGTFLGKAFKMFL
ncbi:hypothetical protein AJ78_02005 [Emergomyces pasteurianus Ep9510]|uniref:Uncharacterized protein n=1 Tax=Emergomyces pasteurianus Ep9510 TaxID=1447872 RepID=A0A1J9PP87_9EURO|nr:hypothetical protein AJ78_02005 [Emergomyces pasteurianus Ep9510]